MFEEEMEDTYEEGEIGEEKQVLVKGRGWRQGVEEEEAMERGK